MINKLRTIFFHHSLEQPVKSVWIVRFLVVLLIIVVLIAGYYYTQYTSLQRQYRKLQNQVRLYEANKTTNGKSGVLN